MKNLRTLQIPSLFFLIIMLLSSCGVIKNNDFQSQKYTNFSKGESTANRNQVTKEKKECQLYAQVSEKADASVSPVIDVAETSQTNVAPIAEPEKVANKILSTNPVLTRKADKVKRNRDLSLIMNRISNNANTTSYHGGVDLVVLVILAIFIPPLSVFLARGLRTEFWIDLILTCLFWIPGVIYALIVAFDV